MTTLRLRYEKDERLRYISHLDTLRVFIRAMRRGQIPVSYSQGFNPHPLVSFVMPLSLGFTSRCEAVDIGFERDCPDLAAQFNRVLPGGFTVTSCATPHHKAADITAALYRIQFAKALCPTKTAEFFAKPSLLVEKKTKKGMREMDIMPLIFGADYEQDTLLLRLAAGSVQNLNPELVMGELHKACGGLPSYQICREDILCGDQSFQ